MSKRRVMVLLSHSQNLASMAAEAADRLDMGVVPAVPGFVFDAGFAPVSLPGKKPRESTGSPFDLADSFEADERAESATYVVRGEGDERELERLAKQPGVVGVFADPVIEPTLVCGGGPVGSDADVERLLCTATMRAARMDGSGVLVAIVDTGINMAYLASRGKTPTFDAARSWVPVPGLVPGSLPVDHGTMCAYDVCIAAPRCTLLDVALLRSSASGFSALLSDAVRAYRHLIGVMRGPSRPTMVVNNSWGMYDPSWDFPVGHPSNYSDNPNHPFNLIVAALEREGADIVFAAGNCGRDCPSSRCKGHTDRAIYGANGHPAVLCVAGVDTTKTRVGYSSIGPGRLVRNKPDISGYTHFSGSGVYPADNGTSAAAPVVAGVVAAVRSRRPWNPSDPATSPAAIRSLVTSTAQDLGPTGYDFFHGHGVVDGCALRKKLVGEIVFDPCVRYPWLCDRRFLCRIFPRLCRDWDIPIRPFPPVPPIRPVRPRESEEQVPVNELAEYVSGATDEELDESQMLYLLGVNQGITLAGRPLAEPERAKHAGCSCKPG